MSDNYKATIAQISRIVPIEGADRIHISEGIIIRVDHATQVPLFLKNKSFAFKVMEGIIKEQEDYVDEEDSN